MTNIPTMYPAYIVHPLRPKYTEYFLPEAPDAYPQYFQFLSFYFQSAYLRELWELTHSSNVTIVQHAPQPGSQP